MLPLTRIPVKTLSVVLLLMSCFSFEVSANCIFGSGIQTTETKIGIMLHWICLHEFDNDHFIIQRSDDGDFYYSIGELASKESNGQAEYRFLDPTFGEGQTWYRIKSVDPEGNTLLGPECRIDRKIPNRFIVSCIGDLEVEDELRINIECASGEMLHFQVLEEGREHNLHGVVKMEKGDNILSIPFTILPSGNYHVTLYIDGERESIYVRKLSRKDSGLLTGN